MENARNLLMLVLRRKLNLLANSRTLLKQARVSPLIPFKISSMPVTPEVEKRHNGSCFSEGTWSVKMVERT